MATTKRRRRKKSPYDDLEVELPENLIRIPGDILQDLKSVAEATKRTIQQVAIRYLALGLHKEDRFIKLADLEIDRLSSIVKRGGRTINLTLKEYSLLEQLALAPKGKAVTRTDLVARAWGLTYEGLTNIVDVYISYLRQKIDDGFDLPLIRTARFVGYYLSDTKLDLTLKTRPIITVTTNGHAGTAQAELQ